MLMLVSWVGAGGAALIGSLTDVGVAPLAAPVFDWARASYIFANREGHVHASTGTSQERFARLFDSEALRSLIRDGLVEVYDELSDSPELSRVESPNTDQAEIRRYWFRPTARGKQIWKEWDAPSLPE
jgi:hypothetical protein